MNKFLMGLLFSLPFTAIAANQEEQDLCFSQFSNQCQVKCQETNDVNCAQRCQEDAINQCKKAGE
jgi:hypothetical protein